MPYRRTDAGIPALRPTPNLRARAKSAVRCPSSNSTREMPACELALKKLAHGLDVRSFARREGVERGTVASNDRRYVAAGDVEDQLVAAQCRTPEPRQ